MVDVLDELTPLLLLRVELSPPVLTRVRELLVVAWLRVDDDERPEVTASPLLLDEREEDVLVPTRLSLDLDDELLTPAPSRDELLLELVRFLLLSLDEALDEA